MRLKAASPARAALSAASAAPAEARARSAILGKKGVSMSKSAGCPSRTGREEEREKDGALAVHNFRHVDLHLPLAHVIEALRAGGAEVHQKLHQTIAVDN